MTSTWIVGVDGSDDARHAAEWAVDQAVGRDVRIIALATWTVPIAPMAVGFSALDLPYWSELESEVQRSTEELVARLSRDRVEVEARVAQGPAAQVLIEASRDADLLVVGARGLGRVKGLILGSVSQACVSHSSVPTAVIAIEAPRGPARRIVVGYDASPNAQTAARWVLRFADSDAAITILDALAIAPWLEPNAARERFAAEIDTAEKEFRAHMAELDPDNRATHSFVVADARVALLNAAENVDLVVLGSRGRGKLGAMLLGSTTTWMLHSATRATIVVPASTETTA